MRGSAVVVVTGCESLGSAPQGRLCPIALCRRKTGEHEPSTASSTAKTVR